MTQPTERAPNVEDFLPAPEEVEIPEEILALRAELEEERRRYGGVPPYTPERMAKIRKAVFYPPLTEEEIDSYLAAVERRRDCCH